MGDATGVQVSGCFYPENLIIVDAMYCSKN